MAYAAVVSVMKILENILHPHLGQRQIPWRKKQIESLLEMMSFFHDFLVDSWQRRSRVVRCLERKIRDAAYKTEDLIESHISEHLFSENNAENKLRRESIRQSLNIVNEEIDSIKIKVIKLKDSWRMANDLRRTHSLPHVYPSRLASSRDNTMVGFDDDLKRMKDRLTGYPSKLQIIPIIGMGGIGKTSLARNLYRDEYIAYHFDVLAWATISQNYKVKEILLGLLESMRKITDKMYQESNEQLSEYVYKFLKGRRYLVVTDDVWDKESWDSLRRLFPDDNTGSRVVLTTRLSDVAAYTNSHIPHHYHMHFLNHTDSWILLCSKVFGETCFPSELEEVGKNIALSCKGLPLAIVVISGLLSKVSMTRDQWEYVANNLNKVLIANSKQCTELLSLSYDHLPHPLKACFLYTGVFPEDIKIPVSKLLKLWIAEGFLKTTESKSLEEVAEEYLADLISRNLIISGEMTFDGKIKTCSIHDLLRDLCLSKAQEEKLFYSIKSSVYKFSEVIKDPRRLSIHCDFSHKASEDIYNRVETFSLVRSLLYQSDPHVHDSGSTLYCCKLLRVLDLTKVDLFGFPSEILNLVHLRYVSLSCQEKELHLPISLPYFLWNLQTLIIYQRFMNSWKTRSAVYLPQGIWRLSQLRHLLFGKICFPCPVAEPGDGQNSNLENLHTLSKVSHSSCKKEFFKRTPNLKKLGIRIEGSGSEATFSLGNVVNLPQLEKLKCIVAPGSYVSVPKNFTLPANLKKLTLNGTRISWEDMSIVGSLHNLQVLKLIDHAFQGSEWEPIYGEFCGLTSLLIDRTDLQHWRANSGHFPRLQRLSLWECAKMEEIPCDIGDIPTLQIIELDDASPSAVTSAKQIKEEQKGLGNEQLQVVVYCMWEYVYQKREEEKRRREEEKYRWREEEKRQREEEKYRWREEENRRRKEEEEARNDRRWRFYGDNDFKYDNNFKDEDNFHGGYFRGGTSYNRYYYNQYSTKGDYDNEIPNKDSEESYSDYDNEIPNKDSEESYSDIEEDLRAAR